MSVIGLIGGASGKDLTEQLKKKGFQVALVAGKMENLVRMLQIL